MKKTTLLVLAIILAAGCCPFRKCTKEVPMPEETQIQPEVETPRVNLKFMFSVCNDVDAMRNFYTDLLGMQENAYYKAEDGSFGYLSYMSVGGIEIDFFYIGKEAPPLTEWAWQPGYEGGSIPVTSWAIEIPADDYKATIKRLQDAGVKAFTENPEWRLDSYWGFSVMDPQGNTIEVYTMPKTKPASPEWPFD